MPRALENDRFLIISSRESGWLEGCFDPSGLSDIQPVGWMQVFNPRVVLTKLYRFFHHLKLAKVYRLSRHYQTKKTKTTFDWF